VIRTIESLILGAGAITLPLSEGRAREAAMAQRRVNIASVDPVWSRVRVEAEEVARDEPLMASLVHAGVLHHASLERALSFRIAQKLASGSP
jgi:hypothetical protein